MAAGDGEDVLGPPLEAVVGEEGVELVGGAGVERGGEQIGLAGEAAVDGAGGDAGPAGDLGDAGALVAPLGEHLGRGVEETEADLVGGRPAQGYPRVIGSGDGSHHRR